MGKYILMAALVFAHMASAFADSDDVLGEHEREHMDQARQQKSIDCGSIRAGQAVNGSNPNSNGPGAENNGCARSFRSSRHFFFVPHANTAGNANGADPAGAGR